jgi:hypothetical protein
LVVVTNLDIGFNELVHSFVHIIQNLGRVMAKATKRPTWKLPPKPQSPTCLQETIANDTALDLLLCLRTERISNPELVYFSAVWHMAIGYCCCCPDSVFNNGAARGQSFFFFLCRRRALVDFLFNWVGSAWSRQASLVIGPLLTTLLAS